MNSSEMKAVMKRYDDTQEKLADAMGLQISGINARINGHVDFRASEIRLIKNRYNLSAEETDAIFFSDGAS